MESLWGRMLWCNGWRNHLWHQHDLLVSAPPTLLPIQCSVNVHGKMIGRWLKYLDPSPDMGDPEEVLSSWLSWLSSGSVPNAMSI